MGKIFVKYASVLLVLWYSLSIIGFDVHSCRSTGEVFVASLAGGVSCEDIHPEHSCRSHGGCCHLHETADCCGGHQEASCCEDHGSRNCCGEPCPSEREVCIVEKEGCCSNDLQVLLLTGVHVSENESTGDSVHFHQFTFDVDLAMELAMPSLQRPLLKYLEHPDSGVVMSDRQAFFSIWIV